MRPRSRPSWQRIPTSATTSSARGGLNRGTWWCDLALTLALGGDADDSARQVQLFEPEDHPRRRIERALVPAQPSLGRAREGVVVVVPGLAEARQREPRDVGRMVV